MTKPKIAIVMRALRKTQDNTFRYYTLDTHVVGDGYIAIYPEKLLNIYKENAHKLADTLGWFTKYKDVMIDYQLSVEEIDIQETTANYFAHEYNETIPAKITVSSYFDGTYDILCDHQDKKKIILDGYDSTYDSTSMYEAAFGVERTTFPTRAEVETSSLTFDPAGKDVLVEIAQWSNGCGDTASFHKKILFGRRFKLNNQIIVAKPE